MNAFQALLAAGHSPENITIAGDSAGGNLVLATLLCLRDRGSLMPGAAVVLSPLLDLTFSGDSRRTNAWRDPMLPNIRGSNMHQIYQGETPAEDPYVSPIFGDFSALPPILGQVGSSEILLDDTVRAAECAREAGIPFFLEIWEGMPHVWQIMSFLPEAEAAIERIATFIQKKQLDPWPLPQQSALDQQLDRFFKHIPVKIPVKEIKDIDVKL